MRIRTRRLFVYFFSVSLAVTFIASGGITISAKASGEGWLSGWGYRSSHVINAATGAGTNYPVKIKAMYNGFGSIFYDLTERQTLISGTGYHGFDVVHTSKIVAVNKFVDGSIRVFLAYDSDSEGSQIRLYYTNNLDGPWTAFSGNPILSGKNSFRTPTVVFVDGTFHMFLCNKANKRI